MWSNKILLTIKYLISPKLSHKFCCFSAFHIFSSPLGVELQKFWLIFICASFAILTTAVPNFMLLLSNLILGPFSGLNFRTIIVLHRCRRQPVFFQFFVKQTLSLCLTYYVFLKGHVKKNTHSSKELKKVLLQRKNC